MGMFKDMRDLHKTGKQMTKDRGGSFKMMKDGLAQANEAMQQVQTDRRWPRSWPTKGSTGPRRSSRWSPPARP